MDERGVVVPLVGVLELLLLASLSAVAFRRIRFPYTIGLVIVGAVLAVAENHLDLHFLEPMRHIRLTPEVVLYLFIPTLVFPAAVRLDLSIAQTEVSDPPAGTSRSGRVDPHRGRHRGSDDAACLEHGHAVRR